MRPRTTVDEFAPHRLSSDPTLRLARQRQPPARYPGRSRVVTPAGTATGRGSEHQTRRRSTYLRVPALRCADAHHRELHARPTDPRAAGRALIMPHTALPDITESAASTTTMPQRTPMASCCKTRWHHCYPVLSAARNRRVLGAPATRIVHAAATIFSAVTSADVQIPIALRLC